MDRLQLAQQTYEGLAPALARGIDDKLSARLEKWLVADVCPVVENLVPCSGFQRFARWSIEHLAPGARAQERSLVEGVDSAIVGCASKLIVASVSPSSTSGAAGEGRAAFPDLAIAKWIVGRPWFDLVCPQEYFHADRGLHLRELNSERTQEFRQRYELRAPLGDYVLRSMFARIEYLSNHLGQLWVAWIQVGQAGQVWEKSEKLFAAKMELDQSIRNLKKACLGGHRHRLREACATLTQVYTAYAPNPDLSWLGFPHDWGPALAPQIRSCVRPPGKLIRAQQVSPTRARVVECTRVPLCRPDVVQQIAAALDDIGLIYRTPVETEELIEWARQHKRLVLVDRRPRSVLWDGEQIDGDWDRNPKPWEFLWALARGSRRGKPIDRDDLSSPGSARAIVHRRSRLSKMIPGTLDALIESVRTRSYLLRLSPDEVSLLECNADEQLVEAGPEIGLPWLTRYRDQDAHLD